MIIVVFDFAADDDVIWKSGPQYRDLWGSLLACMVCIIMDNAYILYNATV